MTTRISSSFAFTTTDRENDSRVLKLRQLVALVNEKRKIAGVKSLYRLEFKGRLGEDSPHAHLYAVGGALHRESGGNVCAAHAARFDVYVRPATR